MWYLLKRYVNILFFWGGGGWGSISAKRIQSDFNAEKSCIAAAKSLSLQSINRKEQTGSFNLLGSPLHHNTVIRQIAKRVLINSLCYTVKSR